MARLAVVSFRLGARDGVSIEAAKWIAAFESLGHQVMTLAGEGVADVVLPSLAIGATSAPSMEEVTRAFEGVDLVVVENFVSLPLNRGARDVVYRTLEGRCALFRHHDLPWQRDQWRDDDAPRNEAQWHHVTINELSRRELAARGVEATTVHNTFDCTPPKGRRDLMRRALAVSGERLLLMPTRAIARKNVAGALELARALGGVFWLLGEAEDGYGGELHELLAHARVRVLRGLPLGWDVHDAYAASDLVVMPSTWEGFGNPVLESVTHRRFLAVHPYPVLSEIESFGFRFFALDDVDALEAVMLNGDETLLEHNAALAHEHFNVSDLPQRLAPLLGTLGVK